MGAADIWNEIYSSEQYFSDKISIHQQSVVMLKNFRVENPAHVSPYCKQFIPHKCEHIAQFWGLECDESNNRHMQRSSLRENWEDSGGVWDETLIPALEDLRKLSKRVIFYAGGTVTNTSPEYGKLLKKGRNLALVILLDLNDTVFYTYAHISYPIW